MKKFETMVYCYNPKDTKVKAYSDDKMKGLCIHRHVLIDDRWVITHISSGYRFPKTYKTRANAAIVARLASNMYNFNCKQIPSDIKRRKVMKDRLVNLLKITEFLEE